MPKNKLVVRKIHLTSAHKINQDLEFEYIPSQMNAMGTKSNHAPDTFYLFAENPFFQQVQVRANEIE